MKIVQKKCSYFSMLNIGIAIYSRNYFENYLFFYRFAFTLIDSFNLTFSYVYFDEDRKREPFIKKNFFHFCSKSYH